MSDYQDYLQSTHWRDLRRLVLQRDDHACRLCGSKAKPLNVHHIRYRGWYKEEMSDLITLCADCHHAFHAVQRVRHAQGLGKLWQIIRLLWVIL